MEGLDKEVKEQKEMMEIVDAIADLNHEYLRTYFKFMVHTFPDLPKDIKRVWESYLVPYEQLREDDKEKYRLWSARIIERIFEVA